MQPILVAEQSVVRINGELLVSSQFGGLQTLGTLKESLIQNKLSSISGVQVIVELFFTAGKEAALAENPGRKPP